MERWRSFTVFNNSLKSWLWFYTRMKMVDFSVIFCQLNLYKSCRGKNNIGELDIVEVALKNGMKETDIY
jgi:hypothetical protein